MNDAVSVLSSRADAESLNQLSRAYFAMEQWDEGGALRGTRCQLDRTMQPITLAGADTDESAEANP